jgi:hypothetical protein
MLSGMFSGLLAGLSKILPLFQLLFEIFQPGDGEKVTRAGKICALAISALILYSGFVSFAYVEQYHAYVEATAERTYQLTTITEKKGELASVKAELNEYRSKYFTCIEDGSYNQPDRPLKTVETPPRPVHAINQPKVPKRPPKHPVGMQDGSEFRQELLKELNKE